MMEKVDRDIAAVETQISALQKKKVKSCCTCVCSRHYVMSGSTYTLKSKTCWWLVRLCLLISRSIDFVLTTRK